MSKTPGEEFIKRKRANPKKEDLNKPTRAIKKLPSAKQAHLVPSLTDIKTDPKDVAKYKARKVSLISKKDFKNLNQKVKDDVFGSIKIATP